jgi:hypothetical protein
VNVEGIKVTVQFEIFPACRQAGMLNVQSPILNKEVDISQHSVSTLQVTDIAIKITLLCLKMLSLDSVIPPCGP